MKDSSERMATRTALLDRSVRTEGCGYVSNSACSVYETLFENGIDMIDAASVLYSPASDIGRGRMDDIREQVDARRLLYEEGHDFISHIFCSLYADESISAVNDD